MNIETIHESLQVGQKKQMVEQIDEYDLYDFWKDYTIFLDKYLNQGDCYGWFSDAVISYHRIKNR